MWKKIKKGLLRDEFYQYSDSHVNAIVNGKKKKKYVVFLKYYFSNKGQKPIPKSN